MRKINCALVVALVAALLAITAPSASAIRDPDPKKASPGNVLTGAVETGAADLGAIGTIRDPDNNSGERYRWGTAHHNDGSPGNDEWWITGTTHNHYEDVLGGRDWVRPSFSIAHYNQEGTHMGCNDLDTNELIWVKVNFYMWDRAGRNWNPGPIYLPCKSDTTATKVQDYVGKDVPKLYWVEDDRGRVHAPNWKFTWEIIKANGIFQGHGTVQGKYRPCSGPRYSLCPPL